MDKLKIKGAIIAKYGSQYRFARELRIRESRLSRLLNGSIEPNPQEIRAMRDKLGIELSAVSKEGVHFYLRCLRCAFEWIPRKENPLCCPNCKSRRWNDDGKPKVPVVQKESDKEQIEDL